MFTTSKQPQLTVILQLILLLSIACLGSKADDTFEKLHPDSSNTQFYHSHSVDNQVTFKSAAQIPLSSYDCLGHVPEEKRCYFRDVFIWRDKVWVVTDNAAQVIIPQILCTAITDPNDKLYCNIETISRERLVETIASKPVSIYSSGIIFGRLAPPNYYHTIFEEMIPVFDIILSSSHKRGFAHWKDPHYANASLPYHGRRDIYFAQENRGEKFSKKMWNRYFPHVDVLDMGASEVAKELPRLVKVLAAGSNASCAHYFHCRYRPEGFANPTAAIEYRKYVLSITGIDVSIGPPTRLRDTAMVIIINRAGSRRIHNVEELERALQLIKGVEVAVIDFASLTLDKQIQTTYAADFVIMVHGGGLGNVLFMQEGSTLIDVYPYNFPFSFHGLVNWLRYSMLPVRVSHAPFDIIRSDHMFYHDRKQLPRDCYCDTTSRLGFFNCGLLLCFYQAQSLIVDLERFIPHFTHALDQWRSQTGFERPMTMLEFRTKFNSLEPWYYKLTNTSASSPYCKILD